MIECKLRRLGNSLWVNDEQHLDVVRDGGRIRLDFPDVEIALQLLDQDPGWFTPLLHRHHRTRPHHRQRTEHADDWFVRRHDARDGARDVVFEEALALRAEERDRFFLIQQADAQTEIDTLAIREKLRLDAFELGGIFRVGVRLGIELLDLNQAARILPIFAQQIVDLLGISLQKNRHTLGTLEA